MRSYHYKLTIINSWPYLQTHQFVCHYHPVHDWCLHKFSNSLNRFINSVTLPPQHSCVYTIYMVYLAVALIWRFGESCIYCQIKCMPFRLQAWALSIQYSKSLNKNLANCIFRGNCQIFDSAIIPRIQYLVLMQVRCIYACRNTSVKVDVTFHFVRCLVIILIVHTDFT